MKRLLLTFLLFGAHLVNAGPVDTLTVMTYNVLNYPDASDNRVESLRKVIHSVDPDILVVQEMWENRLGHFRSNIFPEGGYSYAPFIGNDTNVALFFRNGRISYLGQRIVSTSLRNIVGYELRMQSTEQISYAFWIFGLHLKAGNDEDEVQQRESEISELRGALADIPQDAHYLVTGDFNLYRSSEPAYQILIDGFAVDLFDPIDQPGNWHSNWQYSDIHTQSTRSSDIGDGGSSGGLDDRFDFILLSSAFQDSTGLWYMENSYLAYGNDGDHLNQSINAGGNSSVDQTIADALYRGSDHLPVVAKLIVQKLQRGDMDADGRISQNDIDQILDIILEVKPNPTTTEIGLADVNSDGTVDVRDVVVLLRQHSQ